MNTSAEEALWVLRAQCGDRQALELLLRSVQPSLLRYLRGLVGADEADDLLQDVLVLLSRKLGWLRDPVLCRPWAFRIASRTGFRHLKRKHALPRNVGDETLETMPTADTPPTTSELDLLSSIEGVSPASRAVLVLHFREEMTLSEVAAVLELPLGTVRSRLAYGLATLRKQLGDRRSRQCFAGAGVLVRLSGPLAEDAPAQANTDAIGGRRDRRDICMSRRGH